MRNLVIAAGALALVVHAVGAQDTRADSLRRKQIADSIALMRALQGASAASQPQQQQQPVQGGGPTNPRLLPDISAVGDLVGDLSPKGTTQADKTRFSVREVEIAVQAVVDPYFRGDVFLGISDLEKISIEQAFLSTTSLPDIEFRLGRELLPFGKQNTTHRHDLHTIEYPWVIQRFLSDDGIKGTGVYASKIFAPFGFYQEFIVTANDRLHEAPEGLVPFESVNKSLGGLAYSARLRNYWDLSESTNLELSGSAITGKVERGLVSANGTPFFVADTNATIARQTMFGGDFTFRWRPLQQGLYKSLILQGELMHQRNEENPVVKFVNPAGGVIRPLPGGNFTGGYVFARWQLSQRLFVGGRYDNVQDPLSGGSNLTAGSGYLEWFPSEFSKLVAGYERLNQPGTDGLNRILLQASFALGPHKPHPF